MDIRIDSHTLERAIERGTNEEEIRKVVETGTTDLQNTVVLEKQRSLSLHKTVLANTMNRKELK